ncbi:Protein spaetzle 5 [Eumeta japonica]|uniref:Protein spaetzle 5 n=1 Tax=Eumeta variegata TaxID=151549 RepID=A0A4C1TA24_EUMVA|nr:Protein spaetzle 5 [Eumeta japonica]
MLVNTSGPHSAETAAERQRRQLPPGQEELCGVRTEFITPRAALNNRGNWKYVVNMPENMTQLVRAEICTTTQCSGICSLPDGYTSRCEQKYIQKRLIGRHGNAGGGPRRGTQKAQLENARHQNRRCAYGVRPFECTLRLQLRRCAPALHRCVERGWRGKEGAVIDITHF